MPLHPPPAQDGLVDSKPIVPLDSPTPSPTPVVPAIPAIVLKLMPGHCWLHPDGKWTGHTRFVKTFSDVKLMCTGSAPGHARFHHDYETSVANLSGIMDEMRTAGHPTTGVVLVPDQYIRVRHNLFAVS